MSFDWLYESLGIASALIIGACLAYMCQRILVARCRFAWIVAAAAAVLCRRMALPEALQPVRMLLVLASALAAAFLLYRASGMLRTYVAVTYVALVEICFFLGYTVLFASQPVMEAAVDWGMRTGLGEEDFLLSLHVVSVAMEGLMVMVFALLLAFCARNVCRTWQSDASRLTRPEFLLMLMPSASGLLLCVLLRTLILTIGEGSPMLIFDRYPPLMALVPAMLVIILASIMLSLDAVQRGRALRGQREDMLALEAQIGALQAQMEQSAEQERTVRRLRHDLANTVSVVVDLAQHDPAALEKYLADFRADVRSAAPEFQTGNPVADVLVAAKAKSLRSQVEGAVFDADRLVFRKDLEVAPYDMGIILSNALDNAVEGAVAANRANPGAPCFVRAFSFEENGHVFVRVENSRDPALLPDGLLGGMSTKREPGHGLGLRSIRTMVEKYGGAVDCRVEGNTFTLAVMLDPKVAK